MGQMANVFGLDAFGTASPSGSGSEHIECENARLIPGNQASSLERNRHTRSIEALSVARSKWAARWMEELWPAKLDNVSPAMAREMLADAIWITCMFAVQAALTESRPNVYVLGLYLLGFLAVADKARLYGPWARKRGPQLALARILALTSLLAVMALKSSSQSTSLLPIATWSCGNWLGLSARREIWRSFIGNRTRRRRNVMVIGNAFMGHSVAEAIRRDPRRCRELQEFILDKSLRTPVGVEMMARIARQQYVDEVIVATPDAVAARIAVRVARRNQLDVTVVPDLHGEAASEMESLEGVPMLKVSEQRYPEWNLALKRVCDVVLATIGLAIVAPLLAAIAILIKLDSSGPALYKAVRVGSRGRRFCCYKLRTMVPRADELKPDLRPRNQRQGAFFKVENDPRVTRVGRYLRRYSIDELPQLWNVLRGEMSLVGPRPHPADDVERYEVPDLRRLDFVPGITGLWQVTARRDPSFKRSVELDIEYINRWSILLDLKILCRTVSAVLQGSGA